MSILSLAVAAGIYALASVLITYVYGSAYADTLLYLQILLVKYVIWSSQAIIAVALLGLGFAGANLAIVAVSTAVCVLFSVCALPWYGVIAIPVGQVLGAVAAALAAVVCITRVLRATPGHVSPQLACESSS